MQRCKEQKGSMQQWNYRRHFYKRHSMLWHKWIMPGKPHLIQPGNREWVTTIECINSSGWSVPLCMIFKGKVHIEGWYTENKIAGNWMIQVSPNEWTTDEIGLQWLQKVFIPSISRRSIDQYRLLVLDGHESHLTPTYNKICEDNKIISIYMPPHASHLLQPLDVGCFGPLKQIYRRLVEQRSRLRYNHINKLDFLKGVSYCSSWGLYYFKYSQWLYCSGNSPI